MRWRVTKTPVENIVTFVFIVYHKSHVPHGNEKPLIHIIVNYGPTRFAYLN